jgi:hypothetical protein
VLRRHIHNIVDSVYTTKAYIGKPPVVARLIVDTGSSDMWVKPDCYNSTKSTTALQITPPKEVDIAYGKGSVKGFVVRDDVCFGKFCLRQQGFLSAWRVAKISGGSMFDGLLGLAFPALAKLSHPVVENLPGFAIHLGQNQESNDTSFIAFGEPSDLENYAKQLGYGDGYDTQLFTFRNFGSKGSYWLVNSSFAIGSNAPPKYVTAILDSGSSLIGVPKAHFQLVMEKLFGESMANGECNNMGSVSACLCDVDVAPFVIEFPSSDRRSLRIELTKEDILQPAGSYQGSEICRINLAESPMDIWIYGDTVLRRLYTVQDVRRSRLRLYGTTQTTTTTAPGACCGWMHGDSCTVPVGGRTAEQALQSDSRNNGQEQGYVFVAVSCGLVVFVAVLRFVHRRGYRAGMADALGPQLPHEEPLLHGATEY